MIIGVTGDTHNNLKNIKKICSIFNENRTDLVFHTGDISLPKSLLAFRELKCPMKALIGNNDVDEKTDLKEAAKNFNCNIFEEPHYEKLDNVKIVVLHHPDLITSEMLENNDLILHGHTHRYRLEKIQKSIIFNPGECAGFMKGKNKVGVVDLATLNVKTVSF